MSLIGWGAAIISTLLGAAFLTSLAAVPHFANVKLPGRLTAVNTQDTGNRRRWRRACCIRPPSLRPKRAPSASNFCKASICATQRIARAHKLSLLHPKLAARSPIAFYPDWEGTAYDELKSALPKLDWVMPTWLSLQGPDLTLKNTFNPRVLKYIRHTKPNVVVLPVVQNATLGKWDGAGPCEIAGRPGAPHRADRLARQFRRRSEAAGHHRRLRRSAAGRARRSRHHS